VEISSSEEDEDEEEEGEEEEDDIIMMPEEPEEEEDEDEDVENSGSHVNDLLNHPDANGCVLVNVGHPAADADIFLAPQLAGAVKSHQVLRCPSFSYGSVSTCSVALARNFCIPMTFDSRP